MRISQLLATACLAAIPAAALAGTATFNGTVAGASSTLKVRANNAEVRQALGGASSINVWAGLMSWDLSGLGGSADYEMVCIELVQHVSSGRTYGDYEVVPVADAPNTGAIGNELAESIGRLFEHGRSLVTNSWTGAAFQAAVWEAIHDGLDAMDYTSGGISFAKTNGQSLGGTDFHSAFGTFAGIMQDRSLVVTGSTFAISSPSAQDQAGFTRGPEFAAIPLPGAATLATAGLLGLGVRRRR